jgi:hypothetical protein
MVNKDGKTMKPTKDYKIKKLNEDDILEILIEYFQDGELKNMPSAKCMLLGNPGKDLRFVGIFTKTKNAIKTSNYDLEEIDKKVDFNGDHSFLENNPDSHL